MDRFETEQHETEAVVESIEQARRGDAEAQYHFGRTFAAGDVEAAKWYRLAADQGHAEAQLNLGSMYNMGEGVPQEYAEAAKWYLLAANQGNALAQGNLGLMYANGDGVPQDFVLAHKWINLAASRLTGEEREKRIKARDLVSELMTPQQIAEAQQLTREWKPTSGVVRQPLTGVTHG